MTLILKDISKRYGLTEALTKVNATIEDGEFISILGPSGCGKTTLLRIMAGFLNPSEGELYENDRLISSASIQKPVMRKNFGMVFQSLALWPHMSVTQHLDYVLKAKHLHLTSAQRQFRIEETLEKCDLLSLKNRLPGELSGGQQQRVALARAMVGNPGILLMDEPLSALDAHLRISMRKEIMRIHQLTEATIIYITHDQQEALAMSNRIMVMNQGKVQQFASAEAVYTQPLNPFVAAFVGKYNLFSGQWHGDGFQVAQSDFCFQVSCPNDVFRTLGLCPLRPDQLDFGSQGVAGEIVFREFMGQYQLYEVKCDQGNFRVEIEITRVFLAGEKVFLSLRSNL